MIEILFFYILPSNTMVLKEYSEPWSIATNTTNTMKYS